MNPARIAGIDDYIIKTMPGRERYACVLIIRNGYIVYERYFLGDENRARKVWCVTKSVTSILTGIALKEGYLDSVDQNIIDLIPELKTEDIAEGVEGIKLCHVLTMSSGLSYGPSAFAAFSFEQIKALFKEPLIADTGKKFIYGNLSSQIVSIMLTKLTGMKASAFAEKRLLNRWESTTSDGMIWRLDTATAQSAFS